LDDDLWGGHVTPSDYAYHLGGVPGLGGAFFGPHWPDDDWVDPDTLHHPPTFGRMGMRNQGDQGEAQPEEEEDEIPPAVQMTRQVSFSDDSFGSDEEEEAIVKFFKETHIAMTNDVVDRLKIRKRRVNQVLYALAEMGVISRVLTSPPTWEYNGRTAWEEIEDPTESKLTSVDLDKGTPASRPMLTRFSQLVRDRRQVVDPTEIGRGERRDRPENPLVGFSAHPEEAIKGEHLMGDDSYLGERMTFEVRGGKATLDYTQQMDKAGTRETRKAQAEERNCMLEAGDIAGLAEKNIRAWNGTWEPVPEAGNIPGVHIARPTIGNAVKAMRERHFKMGAEVGQMTNKGRKHVQRASSVFKQFLLQSSYETGALHGVYETLCTLPDEFKSGKWTHERFMKALREAGLDVERELKRDLNVKPNEALAKQKPRAIISSKDEGVVRHIFDAGVLEHVLFENPAFEFRSIKHASPDEISRRLGELLRNYDFAASMDFGAFDGSCTSEVRNIVENDIIVSMFSKILGTENEKGLLYQAIFDRIKNQANISVKNVLKAVIFDMIRESGDIGGRVS